MVKQILLRVAAVFAKIAFGKFTQLLCRHFPSTLQIMLSQNPLDPHIDRECAEPLVCKEHHAVCDLQAHARQLTQVLAKTVIRELRPCFQVTFARADQLRRREQVFRAIAKRAFA